MNLFDEPDDGMLRTAEISFCGKYRWRITRKWGDGERMMKFVMLNPSTADGRIDDPTIRRCIGFARAAGCDGLLVFNLSPIRETNPNLLPAGDDESIVAVNELFIRESLAEHPVGPIVAAWGSHKAAKLRWRRMRDLLSALGPIYCFGTTKAGHPKHPLYLPITSSLRLIDPQR